MTPPTILPIATIQRDFLDVIADVHNGVIPSEAIWVSCYKTDCPSVHAKVNVVLDEVDRDAVLFEVAEGDVRLERNGASYAVSCPPLGVHSTPVLLPSRQYADPAHTNPQRPPRRITAFDVAPDGTQFACGYLDGAVRLAPTALAAPPAREQKSPRAHLSTVTALGFFPSSRVLLTAGADFALTVRPADPAPAPDTDSSAAPADPVRVLKGHSRAVTATAIVARGRNVLSAAQDGTLRLWDVGGGAQIRVLGSGKGAYTPINAMAIGVRGDIDTAAPGVNGAVLPADDREVDTADKLVFCALQDGSYEVFDLGAQSSVFQSAPAPAPLTAIALSAAHGWLATGSSNGLVTIYAIKAAFSPLCAFARNGAAIAGLAFCPAGLVVAPADGLAYVAALTADPGAAAVRAEVRAEMVGSDCEAVRAVRVRGREVWTAGDDGVVRVYEV